MTKKVDEIAALFQEVTEGFLRSCAGDYGNGIEPGSAHEIERLGLASMARIKADMQAGTITLKNLSPYLRPCLESGLELAITNGIANGRQRIEVKAFLMDLKELEKAEQRAERIEMYGYDPEE